MKTSRIQVLSIERKQGIGKKSGNAYDMVICQCVVHGKNESGEPEVKIGELVLPRNHPEVKAGMYDGEFGLAVDQQTKRIGGVLVQLFPVTAAAAAKAAS